MLEIGAQHGFTHFIIGVASSNKYDGEMKTPHTHSIVLANGNVEELEEGFILNLSSSFSFSLLPPHFCPHFLAVFPKVFQGLFP